MTIGARLTREQEMAIHRATMAHIASLFLRIEPVTPEDRRSREEALDAYRAYSGSREGREHAVLCRLCLRRETWNLSGVCDEDIVAPPQYTWMAVYTWRWGPCAGVVIGRPFEGSWSEARAAARSYGFLLEPGSSFYLLSFKGSSMAVDR
jgi:hypothetical protein